MDAQDPRDTDDEQPNKLYHKRLYVVAEMTLGLGNFGVLSREFGKIYDDMIHFLSLAPVVNDFDIPKWISLARWKAKSGELAGADFLFHISEGAAKYGVELDEGGACRWTWSRTAWPP